MSDRVDPAPAASAPEVFPEDQRAADGSDAPLESSHVVDGSSFAAVRWRTSDLIVGLLILGATIGVSNFFNRHAASTPVVVLIVLGWLLPLLIITAWPIWAYRRGGGVFPWRRPSLKQVLRESLWAIPVTIGTLLLLIVVSSVWQSLSGESVNMEPRMRTVAYSGSLWSLGFFTLATCVGAPLVEELYFRGFLQNALAQRLPLVLAIGLQSFLFALSHDYAGMRFLAVLVLGVVLTAHYLWRRSLLASICLHAGINGVAMLATAVTMLAVANAPVLGLNVTDPEAGLRVSGIYSGGAAHQAGLRPGDVILEFDGQTSANLAQLQDALLKRRPGDVVGLVIERDGERIEIQTTLTSRDKLGDLIPEALPDVTR